MITEDEKKQFLKNEERLWDLAAITAAPTLLQLFVTIPKYSVITQHMLDRASEEAYALADALMKERRIRLAGPVGPAPSPIKP